MLSYVLSLTNCQAMVQEHWFVKIPLSLQVSKIIFMMILMMISMIMVMMRLVVMMRGNNTMRLMTVAIFTTTKNNNKKEGIIQWDWCRPLPWTKESWWCTTTYSQNYRWNCVLYSNFWLTFFRVCATIFCICISMNLYMYFYNNIKLCVFLCQLIWL